MGSTDPIQEVQFGGTGEFIFGAQTEQQSYATSYIPTDRLTVTT